MPRVCAPAPRAPCSAQWDFQQWASAKGLPSRPIVWTEFTVQSEEKSPPEESSEGPGDDEPKQRGGRRRAREPDELRREGAAADASANQPARSLTVAAGALAVLVAAVAWGRSPRLSHLTQPTMV